MSTTVSGLCSSGCGSVLSSTGSLGLIGLGVRTLLPYFTSKSSVSGL